ncbi:hypothetical protein [Dactylosporangium salmoneum]|uniref:hypothetical protein n=1 Tax=Dactylosporangium salmoneum TaxID=53361 RepID=UPI0031D7A14F
MIDLNVTLDRQLFDVPIRQVEAQIPADRDHDHLGRERNPANADFGGSPSHPR